MLANNTRLVGEGRVRKVYLAEYGEQTVAVKVLQYQSDTRLQQIEVATMDAVSWLKKWACASPETTLGSHFCRPLAAPLQHFFLTVGCLDVIALVCLS